jgi:hypothetical protein
MNDEDAFILILAIAIVGGFALAVATFLSSLGVPGDLAAQVGMILFFGIFLLAGWRLIT